MDTARCEGCVFAQLQNDLVNMPESMAGAADVFTAMGDGPVSAGDAAEALCAFEAPVCPVDGCKLSIDSLLKYVKSRGADAPRQVFDEVVAPGCAILDVPHQLDADFGSFFGYPENPLA